MRVDGSDRKFYVRAAEISPDSGGQALREFDAALAAQQKRRAETSRLVQTPPSSTNPSADSSNGSGNSSVSSYQQALIDRGYNLGAAGADGQAGSMTRAAVMKFQRENGLAVDGIVGPQTLSALNSKTAAESTTAVEASATQLVQAENKRASIAPTASYLTPDLYDRIRDANDGIDTAQDDLQDASEEQYLAFENQTSRASAYDRADQAAALGDDNDEISQIRQDALEEVVTSEITNEHQLNARIEYATIELDDSTTALATSTYASLPDDFNLSVLGRAGDVMQDEKDELETAQSHDATIYELVAENHAQYNARQNTDLTQNSYISTRIDQVNRAAQLDVNDATIAEVAEHSGAALINARQSRPQNENEQNAQTTADIYDLSFLNQARDYTIEFARENGTAQMDPVISDIDLVLDYNVEDIAEDLTDKAHDTALIYDELIQTLGLSQEFDMVNIPGVQTKASGSALATGATDSGVAGAVMLSDFTGFVGALSDYHNGMANAENVTIQGNYHFQRTIATDERAQELDALLASGALSPAQARAANTTAKNQQNNNLYADHLINQWAFEASTSAEETLPPPDTVNNVNNIMVQYHDREITRSGEVISELEAEIAALEGIDVSGEGWLGANIDGLEAHIAQLDLERRIHMEDRSNRESMIGLYLDGKTLDNLVARAQERATPDGPILVAQAAEGSDSIWLDSALIDDNGDVVRRAILTDETGVVFNPIAGIAPSFDEMQAAMIGSDEGDWKYNKLDNTWHWTGSEQLFYSDDFEAIPNADGAGYIIKDIQISKDENGVLNMSYALDSLFIRDKAVTGNLSGADANAWGQVFEIRSSMNDRGNLIQELDAAPTQATQPWRDRAAAMISGEDVPEQEAHLLDATLALDAAEKTHLEAGNDTTRTALRDARLQWRVAETEYIRQEAQDSLDALENSPSIAALPPHLATFALAQAKQNLIRAGADHSDATSKYEFRDDDSMEAMLEHFATDNGTVGTYSQSVFDRSALESSVLTVDANVDVNTAVAHHVFGETHDQLTPEQENMVAGISDEIGDITGDGSSTVETMPIMYEQEIDGEIHLITDVMFRVVAANGNSRLVTADGYSFKNEEDFRNNNRMIEAKGDNLLIMPKDGEITYDEDGHVNLSIGDGRIESGFETVRRVVPLDRFVGFVGIGAGIALMMTGAGAPIGLMLVAGGATAYGATTAAMDSYDRITHGEDWNSGSNLMNYGTIGASLLPAGSMGRAVGVGKNYKSGINMTEAAAENLSWTRKAATVFTGRNFTGNASSRFAQTVGTARANAMDGIVTDSLASKLLVNYPGRVGGTLGTGMTVIDTVMLMNHIQEHGWESVSTLDVGMMLADIGSETVGAVSGMRFAGAKNWTTNNAGPANGIQETISLATDFTPDPTIPGRHTAQLPDGRQAVIDNIAADGPQGDGGRYALQVQDADGATLSSQHFDNHDGILAETGISTGPSQAIQVTPELNENGVPTFKTESDHSHQTVTNWRDQVGQTDPADLFLTAAQQTDPMQFTRHWNAARMHNGTVSVAMAKASLAALADADQTTQFSQTLNHLRDHRPSRYDRVAEHLSEGFDSVNPTADTPWFKTPPEGVDAGDWASLSNKEQAGFAYLDRVENALTAEYYDYRDTVVDEIDQYIDYFDGVSRLNKGRKVNKAYKEFAARNPDRDLPPTAKEFFQDLKAKIETDQISVEGLDFMRDMSLIMGMRTKLATPENPGRLNQVAFEVAGVSAPQVTAAMTNTDVANLFEGASEIGRGGLGIGRMYFDTLQKYRDSMLLLSYGLGAPLSAHSIVKKISNGAMSSAAWEGLQFATDPLKVAMIKLNQLIKFTNEHAITPLNAEIALIDSELQSLAGSVDKQRIDALIETRKELTVELAEHATQALNYQLMISRISPVAVMSGGIRTTALATTAYEFTSFLNPTARLLATTAIAGISGAANISKVARTWARTASTIDGQNSAKYDLAADIRAADSLKEILQIIPKDAQISSDVKKPDGTFADDKRSWITGEPLDEKAMQNSETWIRRDATSIVDVYLTQTPGKWQVETHVTDLWSQTRSVTTQEFARNSLFEDTWRTKNDPNFYWTHKDGERFVNNVHGTATIADGASDIFKALFG